MAETLTALSQRIEAFWLGLSLFFFGLITPESLLLEEIGVSRLLIVLGGGILLIRVLVGCFRILKTTGKAGAIGYREGKDNDT